MDNVEDIKIDVAKDFSRTPFGRYKSDGDNSAERFRDDVLIPCLENLFEHQHLILDFSRVPVGIGSSFFEETFGGLVRKGKSKAFINKHIVLIVSQDLHKIQIDKFINDAEKKQTLADPD